MGYLSLGKTLDLSKATVSLWFRIPKALGRYESVIDWDFPVFDSVVPLITFGQQASGDIYAWETPIIGVYYSEVTPGLGDFTVPHNVYGENPVAPPTSVPMSPTTIGVQLRSNDSARLYSHLHTGDIGNAQHTNSAKVGWVPAMGGPGGSVPIGVSYYTYSDASYATCPFPQYFDGSGVNVSWDVWHHLLLSWDLGYNNSSHASTDPLSTAPRASFVDSYSMMWCALDGQEKSGSDLPSTTIVNLGGDIPNGIVCQSCSDLAGNYYSLTAPDYSGLPSIDVQFSQGIKANGIFIPAEPEYARGGRYVAGTSIRPIYRVDMAELMIWAGTAVPSNAVKYFISDQGTPLAMSAIERQVGAGEATIKIHGTQAWLRGNNSGHLTGDFTRRGTITPFKPDPQIGVGATPAPVPALAIAPQRR